MYIYKYKEFEFVCEYWEKGQAWGHKVTLCKYGSEVASAKIRYYNRTWEAYTYQGAMYSALDNYKRQELESYINDYKLTHKLKGFDDDYNQYEKPLPRGMKKKITEKFNSWPLWYQLDLFIKNPREEK